MVFFNLLPKSYFGGRVLLPPQAKDLYDEQFKRRSGWVISSKGPTGDFEHAFIKRRHSFTTQNILKDERNSMLSVVRAGPTIN